MSSDPRVHKPRLPKAYTVQQLGFLKSSLPEFERRSHGSIRGDAKKYALERAQDFIVRFGLPDEFVGVEEPESRFKEQIYNWFKNTVGRTRRKLEGRPRSTKKTTAGEKAASLPNDHVTPNDMPWNSSVATPNVVPYSHPESSSTASPVNQTQALISPIQYGGLQPTSAMNTAISPAPPTNHNLTTLTSLGINKEDMRESFMQGLDSSSTSINKDDLRDSFLQGLNSSTIANMAQSFVAAHPSPTPLTPVVDALFEAISADNPPNPFNRDPHPYLRRFLDASAYFPATVVHAGVAGPLAGPRALQMQIRKYSTWTPTSPPRTNPQRPQPSQPQTASSSASSLSEEMQRIAVDRQRRKDHIQWARIHAAALELGVIGMGRVGEADNSGYAYAMGRAFSEMMARDAVWETDEVEWVAGICVLRAVIRTAMRGDRRQRDEYDELLRTYEGRWKEIKDEARQAVVTKVLLSAKDDLARLDETLP
ncbi:hypothetical protein M413DRAFT_440299 [Hebeloma cylindrosporum]|uniref:Uncharacterized protein n=1 Tax=Hebeloma cylindrosporum TaxID=76867 RepID=A0A0C3CD60_HEBCY|nr:hypothetical protein M413DRAFT_440299 [Hebeloma cylindrosporum h7]